MHATDNDPTMATLCIRDAVADDVAALADLATQLGYPSQPEEMFRRLAALQSARSAVLVVLEREKIVGLVQVSLESTMLVEARARIDGLVVDQQHRGEGVAGYFSLGVAVERVGFTGGCFGLFVRRQL